MALLQERFKVFRQVSRFVPPPRSSFKAAMHYFQSYSANSRLVDKAHISTIRTTVNQPAKSLHEGQGSPAWSVETMPKSKAEVSIGSCMDCNNSQHCHEDYLDHPEAYNSCRRLQGPESGTNLADPPQNPNSGVIERPPGAAATRDLTSSCQSLDAIRAKGGRMRYIG